jgi:hypothetical protein
MVKTCEHIKIDGNPCGSPAMHDSDYCYFHDRVHDLNDLPGGPDYHPPLLDDPLAIQLFMMQIANAQACGSIDDRSAEFLLKIARTATANLRLARSSGA